MPLEELKRRDPKGIYLRYDRGELSYVDYDDISITSTGGSTVKADVDSTNVTFSIGKSF